MGRTDKLLAKINDPAQAKNITFAEAVTVLIRKGFKLDGGKGSHQVYRHADGRKIVIPRHGNRIKPIYVRLIRELI